MFTIIDSSQPELKEECFIPVTVISLLSPSLFSSFLSGSEYSRSLQ